MRALESTGKATARPAMLMMARLIKCMMDSAIGDFVAGGGCSDDDDGVFEVCCSSQCFDGCC